MTTRPPPGSATTVREHPADARQPAFRRVIDVAIAAVWRRRPVLNGGGIEILVSRRHPDAVLGGLWELPGGKIEADESPEVAACRETLEETGIAADDARLIGVIEHHDPSATREAHVRLHAILARAGQYVEAKPLGCAECRWISLDDLDHYEWPPANAAVNSLVRAALRNAEGNDDAHDQRTDE
jgi:8-oxo-dGTP diphosphatase